MALSIVAAAEIARPVSAVTNSSHVAAHTGDHFVYESSYQNPGFYAQGRYWIFYEDSSANCEGQGGCFYFTSSTDGVNWAVPSNIGKNVTDSDWSIVSDGIHAFYARYNESSFDTDCNRALLYGTGSLGTGGTIAWQQEQVVRSPSPTATFPNEVISIDSNGQIWIGYQEDDQKACGGSGIETPHIIHANNTPLPAQPLSASFIFSPTNATFLDVVNFNAAASGGTPNYSFSWNFGDDSPTATGRTVPHQFITPGAYTVTLTTADSSNPQQTAISSQTILIGPGLTTQNNQLTLQVPPSQSIKTGSKVIFTVNASDTDGDIVSNSTSTLPQGAVFNLTTGQFSWTPTTYQGGQTFAINFTATDSGSPQLSIMRQMQINVSPAWTGDFVLSTSQFTDTDNWHVDIATLPNGQVYAAYWVNKHNLLGRLYDGTVWGQEEQISTATTSTDVNSFVFASGIKLYAIWYDTNTATLLAGSRGSQGGWGPDTIGPGEARSASSLNRYSLPFTAAVNQADPANPRFYVFWYNQTNNAIDEWSGVPGGLWIHTPGAFPTQPAVAESAIGSFHYSASVAGKNAFGIMWIDGTSPQYNLNFGLETMASPSGFTTDTSWNPKVQCTPWVVTIEQILGSQSNSSGGATESGSIFNPGIQANGIPNGEAKRWLTPGPTTPPGWRPNGPPCTVTNADGQVVSAFVEVRGVRRGFLLNEDYSIHFDAVNGGGPHPNGMNTSDTTFDIFTPGYDVCTLGNKTGCMHTIHMEFDHDWKAAGYCGPNTTCDPHILAAETAADKTLIDFQGFVFWDPEHTGDASHSFSGWELHPLTAWRISNTPADFSLSANPNPVTIRPGTSQTSNITIHSFNIFSGPLPLSATISPSGPTVTIPSSVNVQPCNDCGITFATLNITTSAANFGNYTITVTGGTGVNARHVTVLAMVLGFTIKASPQALTIQAGSSANSTITVTSAGGFSGSVNLATSAGTGSCTCITAQLSAPSVILASGGSQNVTLTVSAGPQTGNAAITVTGTSTTTSSTASTTVTVTGVDFSVTASPTSSTVLTNRLAKSTITVSAINGFKGTVRLTDTVPARLTCSLSPPMVVLTSTTASGTASLKCSGLAGNYSLLVTGSGNNVLHFAIFTVKVQDFTVIPTPNALMVNVGAPGVSTIRVASVNGFVGTVGLSENGGTACILGTSSVTLTSTITSASVNLSCTYSTIGNNSVLVASSSGPLTHNATITFQVVDFTISANPISLTVNAGSIGNSTVTLTPLNGFNRTVTMSISAPSGLTCSLSLNKVTLAPSPATSLLSCRSSTASDYIVTVTGLNGTLSHTTANILFHIVDFTITPSLSSLSLVVGQSQQTTVNLVGVNRFVGIVNLNVMITPSGPSATLSPNTVTLTSTGCACGSSILGINAGLTAGVYTLNVTGTNGALMHGAIIILTVTKDNPSITTNLSLTTIVAGASVTDSANLTGATSTASGTVTYFLFTNGACTTPGTIVSAVTVSSGVIPNSRTVFFNATSSYRFNATYSGDNNNKPASSLCEPLAVQKDNPTITTSLSLTSIQVGQSVTDSGTLSSFFQASGTVNYNLFVGSGTCIGPSSTIATVVITNGVIPNSRSVTFNSTNPAGYSFQAVYSGDANNKGAASGCEPLTVNPVGVTVTTGLSATTITVGGIVSDASTLHGQTSTAGGTITYNDFANGNCAAPGAVISMVTVNNGVVPNSRTVTFNSSGTFSFNAVYSGDANNNDAASGCELLTVNKAAPTIATIISPSATITIGGSATDQASLAGGFPSTGVTGTVTYTLFSFSTLPSATTPCSGGTIVGSSQIVNVGVGNFVPSSAAVTPPSPGFFGFWAVYNGNGNNTAATGNCEPLTVNKQTPTITTTINPSSSIVVGASATDQATITGAFPSTGVSGTVTYRFFGPGNGVCNGAPVSNQVVTVGAGNSVPPSNSQTPSSAGQYSFNATYSGDSNNNQVTSNCELLTVNLISTTTGIVCGSSVTVGVPTSCTVTVSDVTPGTLTPTGAVNLSSNSTGTFSPPSPCTLQGTANSATSMVSCTPFVLGAHNITATYTGDNTHRGSTGSSVLSPGKHSTSISVSCSSPVLANQASTCTATVTDTSTIAATTPNGSVGFTETGVTGNFNATNCTLVGTGSTSSCGVKFTPSASGAASIVGSYGSDSTHNGSNNSGSPASVTVNPTLVISTPSATPPAIDTGQSANLSATFTGGTSPYVCKWLQKAPGASSFTTLGSSSPCTSPVSMPTGSMPNIGSWSFEIQITDSSSSPVPVTSALVNVSVNAALSAPIISVTPTALDLGQSSTLATTTSFSGGNAPHL